MNLEREIAKTRNRLIAKWKRYGPYENFGRKEVRTLRDKYRYLDLCWGTPVQREQAKLIDAFGEWCMNYTG